MKIIRGIYGNTQQTYHLLDIFCNLLEKITSPIPTASTAILKWHTYEALSKHLPPPLAAVGTVAMKTNIIRQSNIDTKNISQFLQKHEEEENQKQQELYSITLGALPSSFFYVISNLCQSLQGVSKAFGNGYLRRSLEKGVIAFETIRLPSIFDEENFNNFNNIQNNNKTNIMITKIKNYNKETFQKIELIRMKEKENEIGNYESSDIGIKSKEDITAILRILNRCANYNNSKLGNTNDLIFLSQYKVLDICSNILLSQDCPRSDSIFIIAIKCINTFSKDGFRLINEFVRCKIPQIVLEELSRTKEGQNWNCLDISCIGECLEIIRNMTISMSLEPIITGFFPLYREHVMRAIRLWPQFSTFGNDILWSMAKVGLKTGQIISDTGGMEQLEQEIKELKLSTNNFDDPNLFLPSKGTLKIGNSALLRSSITYNTNLLSESNSRSISPKKYKNKIDEITVIQYTEEELRNNLELTPGTYLNFGVTTDGGLKPNLNKHNVHPEI